jgi:hypothetical protein
MKILIMLTDKPGWFFSEFIVFCTLKGLDERCHFVNFKEAAWQGSTYSGDCPEIGTMTRFSERLLLYKVKAFEPTVKFVDYETLEIIDY